MIRLPAGRFLIRPFPPGILAARRFAATIRAPRVFFIFAPLVVHLIQQPHAFRHKAPQRTTAHATGLCSSALTILAPFSPQQDVKDPLHVARGLSNANCYACGRNDNCNTRAKNNRHVKSTCRRVLNMSDTRRRLQRCSMKKVTRSRCNEIACILNNRPRKRFGFMTPLERLQDLRLQT